MKLLKKAARRRGKPDVALTDEENPWELLKGAWNGSTAGARSSHLKQGENFNSRAQDACSDVHMHFRAL